MNDDPRYTAPNAVTYPPITGHRILPYYIRLVRVFGKVADMPVSVAEARQGRPITSNRTVARRCWASPRPTTGHGNGWGRMIHDASHYVFEKRHPHARPHDGGHATLERQMAKYVEAKGWPVHEAVHKPKAKTVTDDTTKLERLRASSARWESKQRRAERAIRKLAKRIKYYERKEQTKCVTES